MNLGNLLSDAANKYPNRLAIISVEGNWTFEAFDQRTRRLAGQTGWTPAAAECVFDGDPISFLYAMPLLDG